MIKINDKRVVGVARRNTNFSKIYKGADLVFQKNVVIPEEEREVHYRTSDNQPIDFHYTNPYPYFNNIEFNEYIPELGYCVVRFKDRLIHTDGLFNFQDTLTEILKLPSSIVSLRGLGSSCKNLTYVNFEGLNKVHDLGNGFLSLTSLTSVDLSHFTKVTSIGSSFLAANKGLESIDLSPLSNVNEIGEQFMYACRNIKSIDLSPLRNVTVIPRWFFAFNDNCPIIDFTPIDSLQTFKEPLDMVENTTVILGHPYIIDLSSINEYYTGEEYTLNIKIQVPSNLIDEYKSRYSNIANNFIS